VIELDVTPSVAKLSFSLDGADPRPLSVELITEKLTEAGVCHGILDDEIAKLAARPPGHAVKGVVVARQLDPRAGRPAPVVRNLGDGRSPRSATRSRSSASRSRPSTAEPFSGQESWPRHRVPLS
jgi:hypothetical protein